MIETPRIQCQKCGRIRQINLKIVDERRSYTHQFERFVIKLSTKMTIKDIALFLGVSWDLVKEIVKKRLKRRFFKQNLKDVRVLAIDEISIKKD